MLSKSFHSRTKTPIDLFSGLLWRQGSAEDFTELPRNISFDTIDLSFDNYQTIDEQWKSVQNLVEPFKGKLKRCGKLSLLFSIGEEPCFFKTHQQLLNYIENQYLSVFNCCHSYEFIILTFPDKEKNSTATIIGSLLNLEPIIRCSSLKINISINDLPFFLPIDIIANWLNIGRQTWYNGQVLEERRLAIATQKNVQNGREMYERLKKVLFLVLVQ